MTDQIKRKRNSDPVKCYACGRKATTSEHVPPVCLFPEKKDLPGEIDYRKNLITVPSCHDHNLKKSKDDEYLLAILTTHIENNPVASKLFSSKVMRALSRRPKLIRNFYRNLRPVKLGNYNTGTFNVDRVRINRAFELIAKGVYYHHYQKTAPPYADVMAYALFTEDREDVNNIILETREESSKALENVPRYGANQDVFFYQIFEELLGNRHLIRLTFYQGVIVDVILYQMRSGKANNA